MNNHRTFLILEAVLLLSPVVLLLVWAIPMVLIAFMFGLLSDGVSYSISILSVFTEYFAVFGGVAALIELFYLVRKTIQEERFSFDMKFWFGIVLGIYATYYLYQITNIITAMIIVIPLFILVIHFVFVQIKTVPGEKLA
jgi:hypothetical protein